MIILWLSKQIQLRLSSKLRHFWMFFNHYDIIVEGELTHPFLKIEVLESSDSVLPLRRRMAASKWKRYSNVIARDLSLSCLLLLVLFGAAELGFLHSQQSHRTAIHGATVEVLYIVWDFQNIHEFHAFERWWLFRGDFIHLCLRISYFRKSKSKWQLLKKVSFFAYQFLIFWDHCHGVWKSQKKSRSTLRAKRATFTFWVDKS